MKLVDQAHSQNEGLKGFRFDLCQHVYKRAENLEVSQESAFA